MFIVSPPFCASIFFDLKSCRITWVVRPVMMHWQRHVSVVTNHVRPKIVNSAPWFGTVFCCFCFCWSFGIENLKRIFKQLRPMVGLVAMHTQLTSKDPKTRGFNTSRRCWNAMQHLFGGGTNRSLQKFETNMAYETFPCFFLKHDIYDLYHLYLSTTSSWICWEAGRCAPIVWILDS